MDNSSGFSSAYIVAYILDLLVVVIIILLIMLNHKATQNGSNENAPLQQVDNQELPLYADDLTLTNVQESIEDPVEQVRNPPPIYAPR
ncbi:hypothetical protein HDV06_002041 [Boothiomyces sp. JEL0866]|nr:hypothetical protein HDV06_002041 [Boothiomyces sp. JEL0866]